MENIRTLSLFAAVEAVSSSYRLDTTIEISKDEVADLKTARVEAIKYEGKTFFVMKLTRKDGASASYKTSLKREGKVKLRSIKFAIFVNKGDEPIINRKTGEQLPDEYYRLEGQLA